MSIRRRKIAGRILRNMSPSQHATPTARRHWDIYSGIRGSRMARYLHLFRDGLEL